MQKLSSFLCFLTIFTGIIDPANKLLGLKTISFVLFVVSSIPFATYKKVYVILFFLAMYFFTSALQILIPTTTVDLNYQFFTLKSFLYLVILLFVNENNYIKIFKYFYYTVFVLAIALSSIWVIILVFPALELPIYAFLQNIDCSVVHRSFLGLKFTGINYGVGLLTIITLAYSLYKIIIGGAKKYYFHSILFALCLFISSTRANILATILILGFSFILFEYTKKNILGAVFIFTIGVFAFLLLFFALLSEKTESSMAVKSLHLVSYNELFSTNPIRYLLIGDGPGALFYSKGFGKIVPQTEWTYLDLIRNYGLINMITIVCIFLFPLLKVHNRYNSLFFTIMGFGYIVFLVVSGTNPYLINSVGFTALAVITYVSNNNIDIEMDKSRYFRHRNQILKYIFLYQNKNITNK